MLGSGKGQRKPVLSLLTAVFLDAQYTGMFWLFNKTLARLNNSSLSKDNEPNQEKATPPDFRLTNFHTLLEKGCQRYFHKATGLNIPFQIFRLI